MDNLSPLSLIPIETLEEQAVQALMAQDSVSGRFGLTLSKDEALALCQTRSFALRRYGRLEFGGGVIERLIEAFCDSPYLSQESYAQTLEQLLELFYAYKGESGERLSDEELICALRNAFDAGGGSLELLEGTALEALARDARGDEGALKSARPYRYEDYWRCYYGEEENQ